MANGYVDSVFASECDIKMSWRDASYGSHGDLNRNLIQSFVHGSYSNISKEETFL